MNRGLVTSIPSIFLRLMLIFLNFCLNFSAGTVLTWRPDLFSALAPPPRRLAGSPPTQLTSFVINVHWPYGVDGAEGRIERHAQCPTTEKSTAILFTKGGSSNSGPYFLKARYIINKCPQQKASFRIRIEVSFS